MHWSVGVNEVIAFLDNWIVTVKALFFFNQLIEQRVRTDASETCPMRLRVLLSGYRRQPFYNKIHVCAKSKKTV